MSRELTPSEQEYNENFERAGLPKEEPETPAPTMTKKQWPSIDHSIMSHSGRVSKRSRKAAMDRATAILFEPWGGHMPAPDGPIQPTKAEYLRQQASQLLELAERGMKPVAYKRLAAKLIAQAEELERG